MKLPGPVKEGSKVLPEIPGPEKVPPVGMPARSTGPSVVHIVDGRPENIVWPLKIPEYNSTSVTIIFSFPRYLVGFRVLIAIGFFVEFYFRLQANWLPNDIDLVDWSLTMVHHSNEVKSHCQGTGVDSDGIFSMKIYSFSEYGFAKMVNYK